MSNANLGTATFYITGNASGATNAANQANNALAQMERVVAQNWWGIQNLGLAFAALPGAVAAGTSAAVRSAIQWEDALAAVGRTTATAGESLDDYEARVGSLSDALLGLSQRIPTDAFELASIAEAAGALGVQAQDVIAFTETVSNLANVTDLSAETAAVSIARIASLTGVGAAGFDNLASAITTAGVTTAATETDIANLATRIAGVAKIVGLTADQVIGLAAATRSAGVQTEAGGTAIQKTFLDINAAVRENGDDLQGWAQIYGESADVLRNAFANDSAQVFTQIITNLGKMNDQGLNTIGMLGELGITEQRQIRTLLSLAAAQNQTVNENLKLSTILGVTGDAFTNTAAYSEMLRRRYNTLSNQLQILRNQIFAAAQGFGNFFLPVIRAAVQIAQTMISTFMAAPGPFKALAGVVLGLGTAFSALMAIALLIGPRILIAHNALKQLQASSLQAANAQRLLAASQATTATGALRAAGATQAQIRALNAQQRAAIGAALQTGNLAKVQAAAAASGVQLEAAGLQAATGVTRLATAVAFLNKAFLVLTIAITVATAALAFFNRAAQAHRKQLDEMSQGNLDLLKAMRAEQKGQEGATQAYLRGMPIMQRMGSVITELGGNADNLSEQVAGNIDHIEDWAGNIELLTEAANGGNQAAKETIEGLYVLRGQYRNSAQESGFLAGAIDDVNLEISDTGSNAEDSAGKLQKYADAMERIVDAILELPNAARSQRDALLAVAEAQRNLDDAREELAKNTAEVADAERGLQSAYLDVIDANEALADAQESLSHAQEDAANRVLDIEDRLADLSDRRADTLDRIAELEEKVSDLRNDQALDDLIKNEESLGEARLQADQANRDVIDAEIELRHLREDGGSASEIAEAEARLQVARENQETASAGLIDVEASLDDLRSSEVLQKITKATNDLRQARLNLLKTDRQVSDAEWYLNYLREEGASNRDIEDAEMALEQARINNTDSQLGLVNAEEALADARDVSDDLRDLHAAERDLASARRDVADVDRDTAAAERELTEARRDEAGRLVEERERAVERARLAAEEATQAVVDAEEDLAEARDNTDLIRDVEQAERDLEDSLWNLAEANVEVQKQTALAAGEQWDASRGAHALATEMGNLVRSLPNQDAIDRTKTFLDHLRNAPPIPVVPEGGSIFDTGGFDPNALDGLMGDMATSAGEAFDEAIKEALDNTDNNKGWWDTFYDFGGWLYDQLVKTDEFFKPGGKFDHILLELGKDILSGIWRGIVWFWNNTFKRVGEWLLGGIENGIRSAFGMQSPSKKMEPVGSDILAGLWQGMMKKFGEILTWLGGLPGKILEKLGDLGGLLVEKGASLVSGLWQGIQGASAFLWNSIWGWGGDILDNIWDSIYGYAGDIWDLGSDIVHALWDGIFDAKDWIIDKVTGLGEDILGAVEDGIGWLIPGSPSEFGIAIGEALGTGIEAGVKGTISNVKGAAGLLSDAVENNMRMIDMSKYVPFSADEIVSGYAGGSGLSPALAAALAGGSSTTIINNDTFNLEAHTDADPEDIVNEYIFAKRVRTRA